MDSIISVLFSQYNGYSDLDIVLEFFATFFGLLSVWFSVRGNILVFPTGLVNTAIYVYILYYAGLFGDMSINAYYFVMSIYGWYKWMQKTDNTHYIPIRYATNTERVLSLLLLVFSFGILWFVLLNYTTSNVPMIDAFTTAIFFVGMWLMAKKLVENWLFWIVGNSITIPLYIYKGLTITSIQYLVFTILAIAGYYAWRKQVNKPKETLLR